MTTSPPPVWLITGASSGFGLALTIHALNAGHHVIATSRTPSKTPELVSKIESLGGKWLTLDVTSSEADLRDVVDEAMKIWGRVDILVNSAAYALLGAFECFSSEEINAQLATNLLGPLTLMRILLPHLRSRRSGTIVNISSTAGIEARPSRSMYSASKFALEAASEALSEEVRELGIRVLIVEPGAFGTGFAGGIVTPQAPLPKEYDGTVVDKMVAAVSDPSMAFAKGDVNKGVAAIFDVVMGEGQGEGLEKWLRLPLGADGSARWEMKLQNLKENLDATARVWRGTDVATP